MKCDEVREFLNGYVDDELELGMALQIEKHLRDCAECRRSLEALKAVRSAVGQGGVYRPAPADLRGDVMRMIRPQGPKMWWGRAVAITAIAAVILILIGAAVVLRSVNGAAGQVDELVASHLRSLEANHLLDVESTDQHTVKPWFAGRVEFSPPVVDLSADGFALVGGRLDYLDDQRVAALVYRRNKHIINLFIWPGNGQPEVVVKNGFNLIRFDCAGMVCWAVSDVNAADLQRFCDLFAGQKSASTRE
jgi:anti-sigma factor RsiW